MWVRQTSPEFLQPYSLLDGIERPSNSDEEGINNRVLRVACPWCGVGGIDSDAQQQVGTSPRDNQTVIVLEVPTLGSERGGVRDDELGLDADFLHEPGHCVNNVKGA